MTRRTILIALVVVEAILALLIYRAPLSSGYFVAVGGSPTSLISLANILMLALGVVVGALCRAWQGAIALAMLASLPTVIQVSVGFHGGGVANVNIIALMAPLVAVGLLGWLLRYASAEISA